MPNSIMNKILIEKVRERSLLYDPQTEGYKDPEMRQQAWLEIADELNLPVKNAKNMWFNLRKSMINARTRRRGRNDGSIPAWKYEKQMSFLVPFIGSRKPCINSPENGEDDVRAEIVDITMTCQPTENEYHVETMMCPKPENEYVVETTVCQQTENEYHEEVVPKKQIRKSGSTLKKHKTIKKEYEFNETNAPSFSDFENNESVQLYEFNNTADDNRSLFRRNIQTELSELDETDMFFMSMSKMTKKLPDLEQARIRLELSNSVITAQIAMLNQDA